MFSQLTESQKVPQSATFNPQLETKDLTPDAQEPMQLLLDILKMDLELESGYPQDQEKLFLEIVELLLELLQGEVETKNLS